MTRKITIRLALLLAGAAYLVWFWTSLARIVF